MIRLIKAEYKKIFKKKSFVIVSIIFLLFCILTNFIYKNFNNYLYLDEDIDINALKTENESLDLNDEEELLIYINNLTILKQDELKSQYDNDYIIDNFLYSTIYNIYKSEYLDKNEDSVNYWQNELNTKLNYLSKNDWQYFAKERQKYLEIKVEEITDQEKERYEKLLELVNYRLDNSIPYSDDNYLNNALVFIETNITEYLNLKNMDDLTNDDLGRWNYLKEEMTINEYILKEKADINKEDSLRGVLINFTIEFGLFILIYIIMFAGSIVSDEFNKGTIKNLLTKPYKRTTILTAKLLTILTLIPLIIVFMIVSEIIIGGLILGFDSLSTAVVIYANGSLISYSIFKYLILSIICVLPMYIILAIFAFMLSTITSSTSAAITLSFLLYLFGNVIANLATTFNIVIFKFFISTYWDFSYLLLHEKNPYDATTGLALLVNGIYIVVMLCLAYVCFNKKDVKNI